MERHVVTRVLVPTHMVKLIGKLLVAGKCGEAPPICEDARLH
jgi:hypothetical protein